MTNKSIYLTYTRNDKVIELILKINNDEYVSKLDLSFYDNFRTEQIVKLTDNVKYIFDNYHFIVKNRTFFFENSDFVIKYEFNNNNNNLILNIYKFDMWLFNFNFTAKIYKNNSLSQIDVLSNLFNQFHI